MKFLFPRRLTFTLSAASASSADSKTVSYKSGDETVQGILYTSTGLRGPRSSLYMTDKKWNTFSRM